MDGNIFIILSVFFFRFFFVGAMQGAKEFQAEGKKRRDRHIHHHHSTDRSLAPQTPSTFQIQTGDNNNGYRFFSTHWLCLDAQNATKTGPYLGSISILKKISLLIYLIFCFFLHFFCTFCLFLHYCFFFWILRFFCCNFRVCFCQKFLLKTRFRS